MQHAPAEPERLLQALSGQNFMFTVRVQAPASRPKPRAAADATEPVCRLGTCWTPRGSSATMSSSFCTWLAMPWRAAASLARLALLALNLVALLQMSHTLLHKLAPSTFGEAVLHALVRGEIPCERPLSPCCPSACQAPSMCHSTALVRTTDRLGACADRTMPQALNKDLACLAAAVLLGASTLWLRSG